mmetsp:Transcript_29983/g.69739  ORF Transcript_29983/g.69739 Transcript_29983/m.69739 type:complete len:93 (+) Transcript_29983:43-321(+)
MNLLQAMRTPRQVRQRLGGGAVQGGGQQEVHRSLEKDTAVVPRGTLVPAVAFGRSEAMPQLTSSTAHRGPPQRRMENQSEAEIRRLSERRRW